MSSKLDPHGPTHSTRRGRQVSTGDSNILYKLIMGFNLVMTLVATCANEHIVENQSTNSTQTGGQKMQDIDDATRQAVYALTIILYIMSAVVVVIVDFAKSDDKCFRTITNILLLIAGILYLSGDNILLLHRRFAAIIGVTEAKDVRSYMVAISLAFMIMSRMIPYIKKSVDDLEKLPQTLHVIHNSTDKTWEIRVPRGYHPEWKTKKTWHFEEITDNPPAQREYPSDSKPMNLKLEQAFSTTKLVSKSPEDNVEAEVRLIQVPGEFIQRTEIDIKIEYLSQKKVTLSNSQVKRTQYCIRQGERRESSSSVECESQILSMKGIMPRMIKRDDSGSWKGTFQITTQFTVDNNQRSENPVPHKTAMTFLLGFYVNLIDYTLIADALYTTVLDEITHQDRNTAEGFDCPEGHIIVAVIILCLLSLAWLIAIIPMVIVSLCSNHYERLGSWEEFKERILILLKSNSVPTTTDHTIQTNVAKFNSEIEDYCEQKDNPGTNHDNCCCLRWCVCIVYISSLVVIAITIFSLSAKIAHTIHCTQLRAILGIVGCIIILLFIGIVTVAVICRKKCARDSECCKSENETSNEDQKCATYCFQFLMGVILFFATLSLLLYLPMYLIADNKFPWICFLPDNDKKQ